MTTTTAGERLKVGELFAGYGGLGMAVEMAFGPDNTELAWFSEFEPGPSAILAHHWPDVPNYGDITQIDWHAVEPVDILSGGFPCQDVSLAGARRGLAEGTRTGLWSHFMRGVITLQPRYVVFENVRGLLSAKAVRTAPSTPETAEVDAELETYEKELADITATEDALTKTETERLAAVESEIDRLLEQRAGLLGDGTDDAVLRALGAVLGDLADAGYDAQWTGLRAADVGAPHGRFRVFGLAHRR